MFEQPTSPQDNATGLTPPIRTLAPWRVAKFWVMDGFRLQVAFMDGTEGVADLSRLIHAPNAGIFATLSNPDVFSAAYLEHGNIVWETGADLAPDAMHQAIATTGVWIP